MQFHGWRIRECTLIDWHGTPIFRVMARDRGEDARTVLGAPRHRADLVHRRGEGHRAVPADAAVSWPQTAHSAKGRGTDDGAPRFRADGKSRQTCGDDCAGAGRGAACPAGGIPGVFGFKLQVFPSSALAVAAGAFYGPEQDSTNGSPRTLLTGDATWQPLQRLIVQAEAHRGSQTGTHWTGVVGQAFWRVGRATGLTVRGEVLDDPIGARTGTAQRLSSVTISPWYFYREAQEGVFSNVELTTFRLPAFSIRPALRIDHSDQPVFAKKNGSLVRSNLTALVELVYLF